MASVAQPRLPLTKRAFDHAETRQTWEHYGRRVRMRLRLWGLLASGVVVLGVLCVLLLRPYPSIGGGLIGTAVLFYLGAFYVARSAQKRLRLMRRVLETYPWQPLSAARRYARAKEPTGVTVKFRLDGLGGDSEESWSRIMSARSPLRWNHWDEAMEEGVWYAGCTERGGVLALPGGTGLMNFSRRHRDLSDENVTAEQELERLLATDRSGSEPARRT